METIFTKIINREIPADIIYESDAVLAFLDINPVNHGHTLVIPKKPFVNVFDADEEIFAEMHKVGLKIARVLKATGLADGVNLVTNNGDAAGQEVFHSHLHVIPRKSGDSAFKKAIPINVTADDMAKTKAILIESLNK